MSSSAAASRCTARPATSASELGTAGPGAMLGELALIADTKRLTSAAAAVDSEVLRLNRKMFRRILEEYPEVAVMLHERIRADLQAMISGARGMAGRFADACLRKWQWFRDRDMHNDRNVRQIA